MRPDDADGGTVWALDEKAFAHALRGTSLAAFTEPLIQAVAGRGHALKHGNLPRWQSAVARLPDLGPLPPAKPANLDQPVITVEAELSPATHEQLMSCLQDLMPWRKGPFCIGDIKLDCEWRSDQKWDRLAPYLQPLTGRTVLDVGCGSGYHLWRMRGAGASTVLGIEPSLLYLLQFGVLARYLGDSSVLALPLTLNDLPSSMASFDTVFSMGVLYHRREPAEHLIELWQSLRPGGELVLETLVAPMQSIALSGRYARMRNIWTLPGIADLEQQLTEAGFEQVRTVSVDITQVSEQRRTAWMPHQSLSDALDPTDTSRTIEGLPRPHRAIVLAQRPA